MLSIDSFHPLMASAKCMRLNSNLKKFARTGAISGRMSQPAQVAYGPDGNGITVPKPPHDLDVDAILKRASDGSPCLPLLAQASEAEGFTPASFGGYGVILVKTPASLEGIESKNHIGWN